MSIRLFETRGSSQVSTTEIIWQLWWVAWWRITSMCLANELTFIWNIVIDDAGFIKVVFVFLGGTDIIHIVDSNTRRSLLVLTLITFILSFFLTKILPSLIQTYSNLWTLKNSFTLRYSSCDFEFKNSFTWIFLTISLLNTCLTVKTPFRLFPLITYRATGTDLNFTIYDDLIC